MTSFPIRMQRLSRATMSQILKSLSLTVSEILKKHHFVTAADIDDSNSDSENAFAFRLKNRDYDYSVAILYCLAEPP